MKSDVKEVSKKNKDKSPRAVEDGKINIGNVHIDCAILDNGLQVITRRSMLKLMGRSHGGGRPSRQHLELINAGVRKIPVFISANNLIPYVPKTLDKWSEPIIFIPKQGGYAHGYLACMIPDICETYIDARNEGVKFSKHQLPVLETLDILYRGLARVGISALVLEACGVPSTEKDYLQKILNEYVEKKLHKWTRMFPKSFFDSFKKIYGLKKENGLPMHIGHFINKYVYKELATGVLDELKRINPIINGKRKHSHHQYLTPLKGVLQLEKQLIKVNSIMCVSKDKTEFDLNYCKVIEVMNG